MKTIFLITILLFMAACTYEKETEYFNPDYEIKVNFTTNEAWESGRKLEKALPYENEICENTIKGQSLPQNVKFSNLCSGGSNKSLNFAYIIISGEINGYFLISYYDNRMMAHRLKSFDSGKCGFRYITEKIK